jgi:hypothetical protein
LNLENSGGWPISEARVYINFFIHQADAPALANPVFQA